MIIFSDVADKSRVVYVTNLSACQQEKFIAIPIINSVRHQWVQAAEPKRKVRYFCRSGC